MTHADRPWPDELDAVENVLADSRRSPSLHSPENVGSTWIHVVSVELKR